MSIRNIIWNTFCFKRIMLLCIFPEISANRKWSTYWIFGKHFSSYLVIWGTFCLKTFLLSRIDFKIWPNRKWSPSWIFEHFFWSNLVIWGTFCLKTFSLSRIDFKIWPNRKWSPSWIFEHFFWSHLVIWGTFCLKNFSLSFIDFKIWPNRKWPPSWIFRTFFFVTSHYLGHFLFKNFFAILHSFRNIAKPIYVMYKVMLIPYYCSVKYSCIDTILSFFIYFIASYPLVSQNFFRTFRQIPYYFIIILRKYLIIASPIFLGKYPIILIDCYFSNIFNVSILLWYRNYKTEYFMQVHYFLLKTIYASALLFFHYFLRKFPIAVIDQIN